MSVYVKAMQLQSDLRQLTMNYGVKLDLDALTKLTVQVGTAIEAIPTQTLYVVSWDPGGSVVGFDWFANREDAENRENYCNGNGYRGVELDEVQVPANLVVGEDNVEITDWLDGFWYDR